MTQTCASCKHWDGTAPDFGTCKKAMSTSSGRAVGFPTKAVAVPTGPDGLRFTTPGNFAVLETAHDFGCSQFGQIGVPT